MGRSIRSRILIADSYASHARTLSRHLRELSSNIEVLSVGEGREALAMTAEQDVHLFLVNGFLKGPLNGFDLCRAVRRLDAHQHTPVILMLSGHLIHDHSRGLAAGADLFLHAPVEKQELWRMVVLLLNEASQKRKRDATAEDPVEADVIELKPAVRILH